MKATRKILIAIAGLLFIITMVGLLLLKSELKNIDTLANYEEVDSSEFSVINVNGEWNLRIVQGRVRKVEISNLKSTDLQLIVSRNDSLILSRPETAKNIRIIIPKLESIYGEGGSITLSYFHIDSLQVQLSNGAKLINEESKIEHLIIKTDGSSIVQLSDDPMK